MKTSYFHSFFIPIISCLWHDLDCKNSVRRIERHDLGGYCRFVDFCNFRHLVIGVSPIRRVIDIDFERKHHLMTTYFHPRVTTAFAQRGMKIIPQIQYGPCPRRLSKYWGRGWSWKFQSRASTLGLTNVTKELVQINLTCIKEKVENLIELIFALYPPVPTH